MQISRLFEITHLLLQKKRLTAKALASHFEVSTRTIYRDVEALSAAGIPIFMSPGKGGGIELLPNYVLNKSLLTPSEQNDILSALQSFAAVQNQDANALLRKLGASFGEVNSVPWIEIDYSDWSNTKKEQFECIKHAVIHKETLEFNYHNREGTTHVRTVNPLTLWFKEKNWYLKGYCHYKKELRLFKLNRMRGLKVVGTFSESYDLEAFSTSFGASAPFVGEPIVVWLDASLGYRVFDEFEEAWVTCQADGSFLVTLPYIWDSWVLGYLLSFGGHARVISPEACKNAVIEALEKNLRQYL